MNVETKYLRMIRGMKRRGRKDWTVYILRCGDGSLYTGIAKDVQARVKQHSEGRGATYTRTRLPVKLLYHQEGLTRSKALIREAQIKAMPRSKKEEIIASLHNPIFKLRRWTLYFSSSAHFEKMLKEYFVCFFLRASEDRISDLFNISTANRVLYSLWDLWH